MSVKEVTESMPTWEVRISGVDAPLTPRAIARVFNSLQDLVQLLGEEVENKQVRQRGPVEVDLREALELRVSEVRKGSLIAVLELPKQQQSKLDGQTLGDKTFQKLTTLLETVTSPQADAKAFEGIIQEPVRRRQVLQNVIDMASPNGTWLVESKIGRRTQVIDVGVRRRVQQIQIATPHQAALHREGRIVALDVTGKKTVGIDLMDDSKVLTVHYTASAEKAVLAQLGRLARVKLHRTGSDGYLVADPADIVPLNAIPIHEVPYRRGRLVFSPPLVFEWEFDIEEGYYNVWRDDLKVLASRKKLQEVIVDLERQIQTQWELYVDCPAEELAPSGLKLRKTLAQLAGVES